MKEYIHIFRDETSHGEISSNQISSGTKKDKSISAGVGRQVLDFTETKILKSPVNEVASGMYMPAKRVLTGLATGSGLAIGAGATMLAIKLVEKGIAKIEERIAVLEQKAREQNNTDNLLIKAGALNITNAHISYDRYGRAVYKYDRS